MFHICISSKEIERIRKKYFIHSLTANERPSTKSIDTLAQLLRSGIRFGNLLRVNEPDDRQKTNGKRKKRIRHCPLLLAVSPFLRNNPPYRIGILESQVSLEFCKLSYNNEGGIQKAS
ncbi:hypothetical protein CDAR_432481 [Caerostris darwini]|uniref:Uncharacterized protein n=1 Tax=Caerostris darwini TaxID=1538125 RepID=A0AAV4U2Y2_9ARAC|nr:hypothetical protein CDAR_432481 [Caerostris darwini]